MAAMSGEDRGPTKTGDQHPAKRRAKRRPDGGHRSQEPHGAAGSVFRHQITDHRYGQGHHDGGAKALNSARGNQNQKAGGNSTRNRGCGEKTNPHQQEAAATE